VAEIKLENGEIPVREFIRQLAKSDLPQLVLTRLYVTKVEYPTGGCWGVRLMGVRKTIL